MTKTYRDFLDLLELRYGGGEKIVCLLFLDPSNDFFISNYFDRRVDYFNVGAGEYVEFFFPGYSCDCKGVYCERKFCSDDFVDFVKGFEEAAAWKYFGGISLLFLRLGERRLHFDRVYEVNFSRLFIDGLIKDYRRFIEEIIAGFKNRGLMDGLIKDIGRSVGEIIPRFGNREFADELIRDSERSAEEAFADFGREFSEGFFGLEERGALWENFSEFLPMFFGNIFGRTADGTDIGKYFLCRDLR
jgi:hypothetical protein